MKLRIYFILPLFIFSFLKNTIAQNKYEPEFSSFNGTVYQLSKIYKEISKGYFDSIEYKSEWISDIVLEKLDIPVTHSDIWMDGIYQSTHFGIIFESEMEIKKDGKYEFSLNSDDGSILWIDGKLIIDNDGIHKMKIKKDTLELRKGKYPIKIWYFQAYPDKYGLQFKASFFQEIKRSPYLKKKIFPSHALNFENDNFEIGENGKLLLEDFSNQLKSLPIQKITIIGHTDSKASHDYNNQLSRKRANAVCNELKQLLVGKNIQFVVIGKD